MSARAGFIVVLAGLCAEASGGEQRLANPFSRPESASAAAAAPALLELRATLVRGGQSSANIGGTIVRIGERVGDYRLVSVHEGAAVIVDAAGVTYVLEIEPPQATR
jgi:hypothetical protein